MALTGYDPTGDFFSSFWSPLTTTGGGLAPYTGTSALAGTRSISMDVKETDKAFEIKADIPGVDKNDIKISCDNDVLRLSVEKEEGKETDETQAGVRWHRQERSSWYANRSMRMPAKADLNQIKASYTNGVLKMDIPKRESAPVAGKTIPIE